MGVLLAVALRLATGGAASLGVSLPVFALLAGLAAGAGPAGYVGLRLGHALGYRAGETAGAAAATARDQALALAHENERLEAAATIAADERERFTRDLATANADRARLKDLTDALAKDARRTRGCLDRDLARRLRAL